MDILVALIVGVGAAIVWALFMAAIIYLPLKALLNRGIFKQRGVFIAAHMVLSSLGTWPFILVNKWNDAHCMPDDRACGDFGGAMVNIWLMLAFIVTMIISPIIANTIYARAPD